MAVPEFDAVIVGAGIAGASFAHALAPHARVLLLEREAHPGVHSTGRSAAMFMESYGPPQVRALTRASRAFYEQPPAGFAEAPILSARGALYAAWQGQQVALDALLGTLTDTGSVVSRIDADECLQRVPVLRADGLLGGVLEVDAMDIDVHALHQGFLRGARRAGAALWTDAELVQARAASGRWQLELAGERRVGTRTLVDAAGAWADELAQRCGVAPLGIQPKRRSAFTFAPPAGTDVRPWPTVADVDERWYFKPDAGQLLGSPANAEPVDPHDVQPEEMDIALAIDRIERMTTLTIRRPSRTWAGLRSFVADGDLVGGFDDELPGFFWLAAQGGYGIQTSPAMGETCAAIVRGLPLPAHVTRLGLTAAVLSPARLQRT